MELLYKKNWPECKKRFELLWQNEILDRCIVAVNAPLNKNNPPVSEIPDPNKYEEYYMDAEWLLSRQIKIFDKTYFGGDSLPMLFPYFGTGGHAKYLTQKVIYAEKTIWIPKIIEDYSTFNFDMEDNNEHFLKELKIVEFLAKEGQGKFFVGMPDNCGSYDALAQLRGDVEMMVDFIDEPDEIKVASSKLVDILIKTGDRFFDAIKKNNDGGSIHGWMNTWHPGKHMQLQCDLSVMLSSDDYKEMIVPELEKSANWLDCAVYHLDGIEQIRHLDLILSIDGIKMIQWTQVAGQPPVLEFMDQIKRIQSARKGLQIHIDKTHLKAFLNAGVKPEGLVLIVVGATCKEEADDIVDYVTKWSSENRKK